MKSKLFTMLLSAVFVSAFAKSCNYSDVANCLKPYNSFQMLPTDSKEVANNNQKTDGITTNINDNYEVIDLDTSNFVNEGTNKKEITVQELMQLMTMLIRNQQILIDQNRELIEIKRQMPQITVDDTQSNILMLEDEKSEQVDVVMNLSKIAPLKSNLQIFAEYFYGITKKFLPIIATVGINIGLHYTNNALFDMMISYIPELVRGWCVQKALYSAIAAGGNFAYDKIKYFLSVYTNIKFSSNRYDKVDSVISVLVMIYKIWHFQPKVKTWSEYICSWKEVVKGKKSSDGLSDVIVETIPCRKRKSKWFNFKNVLLPNS